MKLIKGIFLFISRFLVAQGVRGRTFSSNRQNNTIKLGFITPLTGDEAIYGQSAKNGFELAVERYNALGGVLGKKIEPIVYDDKGDPTEAVNAFEKLVNSDKADAVIVGILSPVALAIAPLSAKYNLPVIVPAAAYADITKGYKTVFRAATTSLMHGSAIAQFAYDTLNARKASIMYNPTNVYSTEVAEAFKNTFETKGGVIVSDVQYPEGTEDFNAFLSTVKESNPDAVLISDYTTAASMIAKQAKESGINATLVGGGGWEGWQQIEDGDKIFEGGYFVQQYAVDEPSSENKNFITAYKRKYNETPDALAALGYDAALIMLEAMRKAGTTKSDIVVDWLEATNLKGVTGEIKFDRQHNAVKPLYIFRIQGGKNILVQKIRPE